jgi:hypothetical protein
MVPYSQSTCTGHIIYNVLRACIYQYVVRGGKYSAHYGAI